MKAEENAYSTVTESELLTYLDVITKINIALKINISLNPHPRLFNFIFVPPM